MAVHRLIGPLVPRRNFNGVDDADDRRIDGAILHTRRHAGRASADNQHCLADPGVDGIDDEGKTVYAANDNDMTLSSTSNSAVGKIRRYLGTAWGGSTVCEVYFEATSQRSI